MVKFRSGARSSRLPWPQIPGLPNGIQFPKGAQEVVVSTSPHSTSTKSRLRGSDQRRDGAIFHNNTCPAAVRARRAYPLAALKFINPNTGFMETTQENHDWLLRTGISHDVGLMYAIPDRVLHRTMAKFSCNVAYSPEWIIHPKDIVHMAPRGSPLIQEMRRRYEEKMQREMLWINATCTGDHKAVVRLMMKRRLKGSIHRALEAAGFDEFGRCKGGEPEEVDIRGTISLHIFNPLQGLDLHAQEFGEAVVSVLREEMRKTSQ